MRKLLQLKTLILLICVSFATTASAYDFYVNGIYYNQYTLSSVEVTYKNTAYNSYSGYISIPSSINVNGKTYAVIRIGDYAFKNCTGVTGVSQQHFINWNRRLCRIWFGQRKLSQQPH